MWVREAGIILYGIPLVFSNYHKARKEKENPLCLSELMKQLLISMETMLTPGSDQKLHPAEYFVTGDYLLVFRKDTMVDLYQKEQEPVAFLVLDNDPDIEKYLNKQILPLLDDLLQRFTSQYTGCDVTKAEQFESFQAIIDEMFKDRNIKN
jgi:hypothetical protein